jgi:hypothetical protein
MILRPGDNQKLKSILAAVNLDIKRIGYRRSFCPPGIGPGDYETVTR